LLCGSGEVFPVVLFDFVDFFDFFERSPLGLSSHPTCSTTCEIVPNNGLVIYCGTILTDEGKEKMVNIDFEPFKPLNTSLYLCDNKFHTEALVELMEEDNKFGFIIIDGNGALYGTVSGNAKEIIHQIQVDLPKKHGRGGQSALRFARLRLEKRHNYLRKCSELATQHFITNDRASVFPPLSLSAPAV